jgi:hypothetical protein
LSYLDFTHKLQPTDQISAKQRAGSDIQVYDKKLTAASIGNKASSSAKLPSHESASITSDSLIEQRSSLGVNPSHEGEKTIGRGGLDEAIRDMRSGSGFRRNRNEARQRPLSRVFLDGSR